MNEDALACAIMIQAVKDARTKEYRHDAYQWLRTTGMKWIEALEIEVDWREIQVNLNPNRKQRVVQR
jgi:carbamoylphosphate synthase large subunit